MKKANRATTKRGHKDFNGRVGYALDLTRAYDKVNRKKLLEKIYDWIDKYADKHGPEAFKLIMDEKTRRREFPNDPEGVASTQTFTVREVKALVKTILTSNKTYLEWNEDTEEYFTQDEGCPQGSSCSPLFYIIYA